VVQLRKAVAEHRTAHDGRNTVAGHSAGEGRPPFRERRLDGRGGARQRQADVPSVVPLPDRRHRRRPGSRPAYGAQGPVLHAPDDRLPCSDQQPPDQSRGAARHDGERRPQPGEGSSARA
jgi:hypothetical protein